MINKVRKLYEDMKTNIKIKKGFNEGKITKYDDTLLDKIKPYDFYDVPILFYLLNPSLSNNIHEISLELARFLTDMGIVYLLKFPNIDYYLIEVTIDNKKYIYDIVSMLIYEENSYFNIYPHIDYEKILFTKEIASNLVSNDFLTQVANPVDTRDNLISSIITDYKRGITCSIKTITILEKHLDANKKQKTLDRIRTFGF
ncbi:MAG: hypothetical protein SPK36_00065 [Bacilli bacterium]|nr:hypothetical protein [Bacilli bacterium]